MPDEQQDGIDRQSDAYYENQYQFESGAYLETDSKEMGYSEQNKDLLLARLNNFEVIIENLGFSILAYCDLMKPEDITQFRLLMSKNLMQTANISKARNGEYLRAMTTRTIHRTTQNYDNKNKNKDIGQTR